MAKSITFLFLLFVSVRGVSAQIVELPPLPEYRVQHAISAPNYPPATFAAFRIDLTSNDQRPSLRVANTVVIAAMVADIVTTHRILSHGGYEMNPLLAFTDNHPTKTVVAIAVSDAVSLWAWNRFVGRRYPKIARYGLFAAAAFGGTLAIRNEYGTRKYLMR